MPAAVPPAPTPPPSDHPSSDPRPSEATELELGALHATLSPVTPPKSKPRTKSVRPSLFARLSVALPLAVALLAACVDPSAPRTPVTSLEPRGPSRLVTGTISVTDVAVGRAHACALVPDGTIACWGNNTDGAAPTSRAATGGGVFTRVVAGGFFTCALRSDGVVECWGRPDYGQAPPTRAASVAGTKFVELTAGPNHACARRDDGAVECWGDVASVRPGPYVQVSTGLYFTCGLTAGGVAECWLRNVQLANRSATGAAPFVHVEVGDDNYCALTSAGGIECWGNNSVGQAPATKSAANGAKFVQLSATLDHACAVNSDGAVECWGQNSDGGAPAIRSPSKTGTTFVQVVTKYDHTCARRSDAMVECFGHNYAGEMFPPVIRTPPTATLGITPNAVFVGGSFTLALTGAQVPGVTSPVSFTYAFDCGTGYGAFASDASATCPAIFIGPRVVRAQVKDQDGDVTEYTGTIQVNAPPTPPSTTSLAFWDFQNVTSVGDVSTAPSTSALAGITARASQSCGGPAESFGSVMTLITRRFGTCYPYVELTLTQPTYVVNITFDHWHNHIDNTATAPSYRAQLQLDAGLGYADVGNQWLLEGNNVAHIGADGALITLNTALQPGTYRLRWMPRGLNTWGRFVCVRGDATYCIEGYYVPVTDPVDTDQGYFAVSNVRVNGYALWTFTGFAQPVSNLPTVNTVKAGSAIPVKFGLGGDRGLTIFAAGYPQSQPIGCDNSAPTDAIQQTVTAGASALSYDATTQHYTYVWKTDKAWANSCRQLTLKFTDGTTKSANFKLN